MKYLNDLMENFDVFKISDNHDDEPNPFNDEEEDCVCTCDDNDAMGFDEDGDIEDEAPEIDPTDFVKYIQKYFDTNTRPPKENNDFDDEEPELELDEDDEEPMDANSDMHDGEFDDSEIEMDDEECEECEDDEDDEDSDYQGIIRTVKGANLVYKRQSQNGDFTELWIYNVDEDLKETYEIKRAIIAGTDIDPSTMQSEDGSQKMNMHTVGNVQYIKLSGLQN